MKAVCIGSSPTASGQESLPVILYAPNGSPQMLILVIEDDASMVDYVDAHIGAGLSEA
jgi:hypothetical protein